MTKEERFVSIIKQYEGIIYKIAAIYVNDAHDRNDLYQDIVYQLWKYFDTFRGESKISTWMYRIAMNTAITRLKKKHKHIELQESIEKQLSQAFDVYDNSIEEKLRILKAHIDQLHEIDKGIVLLLLEGKSYDEMATITGFSRTNIGTRIHRIKKKLRTEIKAQHHEL